MKFKLVEQLNAATVKAFNKNKFITMPLKYSKITNPITTSKGDVIIWFHGSNWDELDYDSSGVYADTAVYFFSNDPSFASYYTDYNYVNGYEINSLNLFDWRTKISREKLCNSNIDYFIVRDKKLSPKGFNKYLALNGTTITSDKEDFDFLTKLKPFDEIKMPSYLFNQIDNLSSHSDWPNMAKFLYYNEDTTDLTFIHDIAIDEHGNWRWALDDDEILKSLNNKQIANLQHNQVVEINYSINDIYNNAIKLKQGQYKNQNHLKPEEIRSGGSSIIIKIIPKTINMLNLFSIVTSNEAKTELWLTFEDSFVVINNKKYNILDYLKSLDFDGLLLTEGALNLILFDTENARYVNRWYYNDDTRKWEEDW